MKILVVEDIREVQEYLQHKLRQRGVTVLSAYTIEEGQRLFEENDDLDLIVMDGCVPGDVLNTVPLVKYIRESYYKPILAISSTPRINQALLEAGCSQSCSKREVYENIVSILLEDVH